jgi:hypothetical protein
MPGNLAVRRVDPGPELAEVADSVLLFVPRAIAFIGILGVGWVIARSVLRLAVRILDRVRFDQAVQRSGVGRVLARTRYRASSVVARSVYLVLLLCTLRLAFAMFGSNPIGDLIGAVLAWLPQAVVAIVVVVVAVVIANAVHDLIISVLGEMSYGRALADSVSLFVTGLGGIAAFVQTGIATTVTTPVLITLLATVAGILIVGVGGGLVKPMQQRWESWLQRLSSESRMRAGREAYASGGEAYAPGGEAYASPPEAYARGGDDLGFRFTGRAAASHPSVVSYGDSALADPALTDPALTDPALLDPALAVPTPADPLPPDPALLDPALADPLPPDPELLDPARADPASVDPALLDPALADPASVDPGSVDPALVDVPTSPVPDGLASHQFGLLPPPAEWPGTGDEEMPRYRPQDA